MFYVRRRGGFTSRLYDYARKNPGATVPVVVDGPYGGIDTQRFFESDRVMVVAGGSGAGWSLAFIEQFARCHQVQPKLENPYQDDTVVEKSKTADISVKTPINTSRLQSLRVILATRDTATRVWFHKAVKDLLTRYSSTLGGFNVEVFLTGRADRPQEIAKGLVDLENAGSSSSDDENTEAKPARKSSLVGQELHGRPQLSSVIHEEMAAVSENGRSLGVFACGPLDMQNDIRNAVAQENLNILKGSKATGAYLHLEHFSWA